MKNRSGEKLPAVPGLGETFCMATDDNGLRRSVARTIAFMRMAAIELRRIAERDPDLAGELRRPARHRCRRAGAKRRAGAPLILGPRLRRGTAAVELSGHSL